MNTIRFSRQVPSRQTRGVRARPARSHRSRRQSRHLTRRELLRLALLFALAAALGLWWGIGHLPGWLRSLPVRLALWFHQPAAWLGLGLAFLASGAMLALLWWGIARLRRQRQARAAERAWRLEQIAAVEPLAFEQVVGHLFAQEGYQVSVTKASGDNGIDLWLRQPGQPAIPVQCKRYRASRVGSPALQAFSGALRYAGAQEGIFVTTAQFTPAAVAWAKQEHIRLIDGPALAEWQRRLDRRASSLERRAGLSLQED